MDGPFEEQALSREERAPPEVEGAQEAAEGGGEDDEAVTPGRGLGRMAPPPLTYRAPQR
jgi:hypothetical protein